MSRYRQQPQKVVLTGIDSGSGERPKDGDRTLSSATMTPEEFDAVQSRLGRMTLDTLRIAREVLVDGKSQTEVAAAYKLSRQRVSLAVQRVLKEAQQVPANWQLLEIWLPPELIARVREMEAEARAQVANS
ncbi:TrfB-related DNA-binding protein [Sphingomonas sp. 179-I 2A4 NHS]|uniref:TrfB-related DNA-binding protein n=1 Tax=unclassified Sphingomonas TaxID=196159 RepID=UPI0038798157